MEEGTVGQQLWRDIGATGDTALKQVGAVTRKHSGLSFLLIFDFLLVPPIGPTNWKPADKGSQWQRSTRG